MKSLQTLIIFCCLIISFARAQSISGNLFQFTNQEIRLEGFNGIKTYPISNSLIDGKGNFKLDYSEVDFGVGYLISSDKKPLFVILSGEDIILTGAALSSPESITIAKGKQNKKFEQYVKEQPKREQALSAWVYLEKMYSLDSLFSSHSEPRSLIEKEKQRIKTEEENFLNKLPKESYVKWFLPTRKLVSSVSTIAQHRP